MLDINFVNQQTYLDVEKNPISSVASTQPILSHKLIVSPIKKNNYIKSI